MHWTQQIVQANAKRAALRKRALQHPPYKFEVRRNKRGRKVMVVTCTGNVRRRMLSRSEREYRVAVSRALGGA